ncbi:MFS transporter [Eubacterium maltosivorans]|uniref:MFS transporter n=1 Tax=Eubacterium maltosivorans TaxID=2041044 RepID=A0A4P9CBJ2_EUBML|nr:MFS transporter [Eubacterium maltosivorans]QCT72205.1 MFS transporter [Eubacterium maltosivorans]
MDSTAKDSKVKKYVALFALILAGSTIYELPYLSYNYYDVILEAMNISNSQLGLLMSIFGFISMIGYFPGGYLADRLSARKLIAFSLVGTGALGILLSTYPSYPVLIFIYVMYGVLSSLTFWAAMLKATRQLGDSSEQGRLFGMRESGTGIMPVLYGMVILFIFNTTGANYLALRWVIIGYAVLAIIGGVFAWFGLSDNKPTDNPEEKTGASVKDLVKVVKMPKLWLLSIVVFSVCSIYASYSYLTPYLTEFFGLSASTAAFLGILRIYGMAIVGGLISGFIADKIGSNIKVIFFTSIIPVICYAAYMIIPNNPQYLGVFIAFMLATGLSMFMLRGIYFAAIDELKIPLSYSGTAMGFVSLVGFIPEAYIYSLIGNWMDKYPGIGGYQHIFVYMIVVTAIGLVAAGVLFRQIRKSKEQTAEVE